MPDSGEAIIPEGFLAARQIPEPGNVKKTLL